MRIFLCPPTFIPPTPPSIAFIEATWPFNINDHGSNMEAAFEELTYRVIVRIVKLLGEPNDVYQSLGRNDEIVLKLPPHKFDANNLTSCVLNKVIVCWDEAYLEVERTHSWNDTGAITAFSWSLYSNNIRDYSSQVLHNIGLELNPSTYQLGELDPEFTLNSFPDYIKDIRKDLEQEMFEFDNTGNIVLPERFNTLIVGPPGYGKTRWSQAFAAEVLGPLGYLVLVIDYTTLQDLVIPSYIGKICIVINDADTLALNREVSQRGKTEQVLGWLDGTRSTYIKPFYLEKRTSIVNIMTANNVDKWDPAALRKGRIHKRLSFDKVKLSDV